MGELTHDNRQFLAQRRVATLATENADGSAHLTAVWFLFEDDAFLLAIPSRSVKGRNLKKRPRVSLMVDRRTAGEEKGVTAIGTAELITGSESAGLNRRIHGHYLSSDAFADPAVGPLFAGNDDITARVVPQRWIMWDMGQLDREVFGGRVGGYLLPLTP